MFDLGLALTLTLATPAPSASGANAVEPVAAQRVETSVGRVARLATDATSADPTNDGSREGLVVVVSGNWSLPIGTARDLCPEGGPRLRISAGPFADDARDVLAALGDATPRIALELDAPYPADDADLVARARAARCLVLEGGTWIDWWRALKPSHKLTGLGRAILDAHESGATVVGVGAAGTYLAQLSILSRAALRRPARDPHDPEVDVLAAGFGLVDGVCLDMAIDGRSTAEAMLDRLTTSDGDLGVWLDGEAAWIRAAGGRSARIVTGAGAVLVFDVASASRSRHDLRDGRLMIASGDVGARFDSRTRSLARGAVGAPGARLDDESAGAARARVTSAAGDGRAVVAPAVSVAWLPGLDSAGQLEFRGGLGRLAFRRDAPASDGGRSSAGAFDWISDPRTK